MKKCNSLVCRIIRRIERYRRSMMVFLSRKISGVVFRQDWKPWMANWVGDVLCSYRLYEFSRKEFRRVIVNITDATERSGLADRLKTMRTAYVYAVENQCEFYIYHTSGFRLEDYFVPNEVDWRIEPRDISWGLNRISFKFLYNKFSYLENFDKEWHFHKSLTSIDDGFLPQTMTGKYTDAGVYKKLFRLSDKLRGLVDNVMRVEGLEENEYNVVHARFTNFFEKVEIYGSVSSTEEQREIMLERLAHTLRKIYNQTRKRIVLFSDSNTFLQAEHPSYVKVLPGVVSHISNTTSEQNYIDKTFVDFVIMSRAERIYSIVGENIYGGGFAKDAAYMGDKPFIQVPLASKNENIV